jgi:hypothetical protein
MWFDILKKPYVIGAEIINDSEFPQESTWKFNKLFQGTQGKSQFGWQTSNDPRHSYMQSTGHWTPILVEAIAYAFFGSLVVSGDHMSEASSYKDEAKPMIKQALKTKQDFHMESDRGYANIKQGDREDWQFTGTKKDITPRGRELPTKEDYRVPNTPKFNYLPDSRVGELGKGLLEKMKNDTLTSKEKEAFRNSAGITENEYEGAIKHLEMMLNKYFGGN